MKTVDDLLRDFNLRPVEVKSGLNVRVLMIGPKEAEALLKSNQDNRKLRNGRVKYYSNVMKQGGWKLTHQGIAFSKSGRGIDLQHRLNAIISSGVTVPFMVVEGLDDESFIAIDQHERRSAQDALRLPKTIVEEARFFILLLMGNLAANPTLGEISEFSSEIEADSTALSNACSTRKAIYSSVSMRCAAILLMLENNRNPVEILNKYRNLVLQKTELWTPSMHAFGRQASSGKINGRDTADRIDLFSRGLVALDPSSNNLSKIQLSNAEESSRKRVKNIFGH